MYPNVIFPLKLLSSVVLVNVENVLPAWISFCMNVVTNHSFPVHVQD